jgi:glycine dehydrogenase
MQIHEEKVDPNSFARRHIGHDGDEVRVMLREVGFEDLYSLVEAAVPRNIRLDRDLNLPEAKSETEALAELRAISRRNKIARSFIGCGYSDCITPPVIQRNILENPGWYTAYTPYQAELAQGRLEALLNFQTMITDLTALEVANASLLLPKQWRFVMRWSRIAKRFLSPTIVTRKQSPLCKHGRNRSVLQLR